MAKIREDFPSVRFVSKASWFWRILGFCVSVLTLGQNRAFCTNYVTTIGPVIALPTTWDSWSDFSRFTVLSHEAVHLRQQRTIGLGCIWLGLAPWALFWLCFPLPLGFSYGRYLLERQAYLEAFRAGGGDLEHIVEQLSGPGYGWAFPFPNSIRSWFKGQLQ